MEAMDAAPAEADGSRIFYVLRKAESEARFAFGDPSNI